MSDAASHTDSTPQIGDTMEDGTVYAGVSPDTGKAMYATPKDAPGTYTFNQAAQYAEKLEARGQQDFRVPSKSELNVLFNNRAAIGGFNHAIGGFDKTGSKYDSWYRSSWRNGYGEDAQSFKNGKQRILSRTVLPDWDGRMSLRCVR